MVLAIEGGAYPLPEGPWDAFVVLIDRDASDQVELWRQCVEVFPLSVAFWRRELYLGFDDGTVWRATAPFGG